MSKTVNAVCAKSVFDIQSVSVSNIFLSVFNWHLQLYVISIKKIVSGVNSADNFVDP